MRSSSQTLLFHSNKYGNHAMVFRNCWNLKSPKPATQSVEKRAFFTLMGTRKQGKLILNVWPWMKQAYSSGSYTRYTTIEKVHPEWNQLKVWTHAFKISNVCASRMKPVGSQDDAFKCIHHAKCNWSKSSYSHRSYPWIRETWLS